ncbi:MAG: hypothetical protein NVS9B7_27210 [Flavisolibacter sp.]
MGGDSIRNDVVAGFSGPTFKYIQGEANLSGGEIMFNAHPAVKNWFHIETAFSLVRAIQLYQEKATKYLPYTPADKWQTKITVAAKKLTRSFRNAYLTIGVDRYFEQNRIYYQFGNETITPGYTLMNVGFGADIHSNKTVVCSIYASLNNLADISYQSNLSRLKYTDTNNATGRVGVFNMGRNFSIKLAFPFQF